MQMCLYAYEVNSQYVTLHHWLKYVFSHIFKGLVHQKMKILSLITHPHVVSNPWDIRSSSEHKLRYFWWNPRALWPSIDSKDPNTIKAQKRSKEIGKIIHVTSAVQL